jgi:molybdate transport system ATP-binding protein
MTEARINDAGMTQASMLQANIGKRFPAREDSAGFTLDLAFEANPGVTALYGPSGAGKTLTLDSIAGFVTPDRGRIILGDRILFDAESRVNLAPQRRACGYVFQNYALFPHMTLRQNLAFGAQSLPRLERRRRIAELLDRFGLSDLAGRYPRQLSGGQKQRGSIARALIAEPDILLLDEPARGLDAVLKTDLRAVILEIRRNVRIPILLVTHDLDECFALADHMIVLERGAIICQGSPPGLLRNPGTAAVAALLGDFNTWEAEVLALDPARDSSCLRMLGAEIAGPYFPGCFKGDRILVCARPEELKLRAEPSDNRLRVPDIRTEPPRLTPRAQSIRADFGDNLIVDVPHNEWNDLVANADTLWIEIAARSLRRLN